MSHIRRLSLPPKEFFDSCKVEERKTAQVKKINQYVCVSKLGSGGHSKVYLVQDSISGEYYAMKQYKLRSGTHYSPLHPSSMNLDHLEREISNMQRLSHPSIISMKDVLHSLSERSAYIVYEWADCGSLSQVIESTTSCDESFISFVFKQIVEGLCYLHGLDIVHQDIKPSNILLFSDGRAKLSDFGIGHSSGSASMFFGSPAYQAPDVFGSDCDECESEEADEKKEDIWSLGVSLYEASFGHLPFVGSNGYEVACAARNSHLCFPDGSSPDLVDLITGMLMVDPEKRLSIEEVRNHRFFEKTPSVCPRSLVPMSPRKLQSDVPVVSIDAIVCSGSYSFMGESLPLQNSNLLGFSPVEIPARAISRP